jgi:hypothetical protein
MPHFSEADNDIHKTLCEYLDAEKALGKPIQLVRSRVASKAVKMLFREIINQLGLDKGYMN